MVPRELVLALLSAATLVSASHQPHEPSSLSPSSQRDSPGSPELLDSNLRNGQHRQRGLWHGLLRRHVGLPVTRFLRKRHLNKRSLQCYFSKSATGSDGNDSTNADDDDGDSASGSSSDAESSGVWSRENNVFSHASSRTADASSAAGSSASGSGTSPSSSSSSTAKTSTPSGNYKLSKSYEGDKFFDDWDFFSDADPTHGSVNYLAKDEATKDLAKIKDGVAYMAVDNTTTSLDGYRDSVRISSTDGVKLGSLVVLDATHMPTGCSTWPAFWLLGKTKTWPEGGEVDILEGVNKQTVNQAALHTGKGCSIDGTSGLGTVGLKNCYAYAADNAGCQIEFAEKASWSFGAGFNDKGGGVVVTSFSKEGVSIWAFPRDSIPDDIDSKTPDPSSWSHPQAVFSNSGCDFEKFFEEQSIVINTTLCGDWAGSVTDGCPDSCADSVADASNFDQAYWAINSVRVYTAS